MQSKGFQLRPHGAGMKRPRHDKKSFHSNDRRTDRWDAAQRPAETLHDPTATYWFENPASQYNWETFKAKNGEISILWDLEVTLPEHYPLPSALQAQVVGNVKSYFAEKGCLSSNPTY